MNLLDLLKAQRASKAQNRLYAISDLREQERVCGSVELVGMIVCDEWMCGVVWMWCVCKVRGVGGIMLGVVRMRSVRCE